MLSVLSKQYFYIFSIFYKLFKGNIYDSLWCQYLKFKLNYEEFY